MTTIKEYWEEQARIGDHHPDWLVVRQRKFPKDYKFSINWASAQIEPFVMDWENDALWNEHRYFKELMSYFVKSATDSLERIRRSDPAQAKRIIGLLKRLKEEAPSSELLGLYATYRPIVESAVDASAAAVSTADRVDSDTEAKLGELSKRFYKVLHSGKAVLYSVDNDEWTTYKDCADHFGHLKVQWLNPDSGKYSYKNAFMAFKEWDKAPRYDGVVFNPRHDGHYDDKFNLWQGFTITAEEGDEDLMLWELLDRICDGNEDYFDYVQKWLAHMVQKPWERPGTALGMSGAQGLGKNAFVETIGMLMTSKQMLDLMQDSNRKQEMLGKVLSTGAFGYFTSYDEVFGNFNALAGNKIFLFLDEATWGGGHLQKARLKTAITGPSVIINDKNMKHLVVPNYRRFIFASNEEFYYGADPSDRRLLPLEYKTENRPTDDWFKTFYETRSKGKMLANLLHRLKSIDLSNWEPMRALKELTIVTGEAIQAESAPDYQQWMDDIADTGSILLPRRPDDVDDSTEYRRSVCDTIVREDDLRMSFQKWTGKNDMKGWNRADFVKARDTIFGTKMQRRIGGDRPQTRKMPPQQEMRARLDAQYKWKRNRWSDSIDDAAESPSKIVHFDAKRA